MHALLKFILPLRFPAHGRFMQNGVELINVVQGLDGHSLITRIKRKDSAAQNLHMLVSTEYMQIST